jgi:predicted metal-dependent phosphoesterase TrpH
MKAEKSEKSDLHLHSTHSDGIDDPSVIFYLAKKSGLKSICITDHNTVSGCEEAVCTAKAMGMHTLPGIEISCRCAGLKSHIHILGYGIDYTREERIRNFFSFLWEAFEAATDRILQEYSEKDIMHVTKEDVRSFVNCKGFVDSRHIAEFRHKHLKIPTDQIGKEHLIAGGICTPKIDSSLFPTVKEAVEFIRELGGIPVFAHPFRTFFRNSSGEEAVKNNLIFHSLLAELVQMEGGGLGGIEVFHSKQSSLQAARLIEIAQQHKLALTGGSDYHGNFECFSMGHPLVGHGLFENLVKKLDGK